MRTVLHYSARCENADTRSLINEEATAQGADELAKDSVNNENKLFCMLLQFILTSLIILIVIKLFIPSLETHLTIMLITTFLNLPSNEDESHQQVSD